MGDLIREGLIYYNTFLGLDFGAEVEGIDFLCWCLAASDVIRFFNCFSVSLLHNSSLCKVLCYKKFQRISDIFDNLVIFFSNTLFTFEFV